ncbi:hypothetical protein DPMN_192413 [Dreissena polymorpha]|uniref:Uncharacterized protein n=1 Tax=Dreissena polymorpha TaxID=45954 RepID=A0A9D3Y1T4_DREPO|nr:hypothetical protein DPMN_192413 [Dreissena polymorpha]
MGNLKAFILAYIFAVVCFAESSADGVNNDVLVLQRLSTLERELHETRKELRESRIDHAKSTELLTREILDSRFEHESTTKKLVNELSDTRAELNALETHVQ